MEKKLEFNGEFTISEIEMVLDKVNEDLKEDCALLNDDFSVSIVITVLEEKLIIKKISNVIS